MDGRWRRSLKDHVAHEATFHKTSIGRNPSKAKMNKSRRRSFVAKGADDEVLYGSGWSGTLSAWAWRKIKILRNKK